jgi:hypothetical protein
MPIRIHDAESRESGEAVIDIEAVRERSMNDYRSDTPKAAFALAALGLTILTLGTLVAAPAVFDSRSAIAMTLASARASAPIEVTITPPRIEVVGVREPNVAWALPHTEPCKPQG